ncbi:hypothetical protein [Haladaptatus sp. NG-SE-30]
MTSSGIEPLDRIAVTVETDGTVLDMALYAGYGLLAMITESGVETTPSNQIIPGNQTILGDQT